MNIRGFLRWQFDGSLRNLSFYGFMLGFLAAVLASLGIPYAGWIFISGAVLILVDAGCSWFRFSYRIYEMEQREIVESLGRKDRGNS